MAERFELTYVDRDGAEKRPYIIHRAPLGTHERMISFLIELYGGAFPTWMAPLQVRLIPVKDTCFDYAREIEGILRNKLIRADIDTADDSFNKKIRNAVTHKIPNMWIIGEKEVEQRSVTWRRYCVKDQIAVSVDKAIDAVATMRDLRMMDNFEDVSIPV
jgi:threonyl-tRNA synthetase